MVKALTTPRPAKQLEELGEVPACGEMPDQSYGLSVSNQPLDEGERGQSKSWLETEKNLKIIKKTQIMGSSPITSWQIEGDTGFSGDR